MSQTGTITCPHCHADVGVFRGIIAPHRRGPGLGPCSMSYEPVTLAPPPKRGRPSGYSARAARRAARGVPGEVICPECARTVVITPRGKLYAHPLKGERCSMSGKLATVPDDLDGPPTLADEFLTFGLDHREYDIRLSAANAERLRKVLAPYVAAGRREGSARTWVA